MRVFNLSEELEKERKKNKELEEENEDLKEQVDYQDLWRKEYLDRIDKAIEYIENDLQSFLYSIEYKTLLDILEGDDK